MACDYDKIERILLNLLSNAIKFTDSCGKIEVNVSDKKEYLTISVKDTGKGIPEEKFNTIFERFGQVNEVLTKRAEGSGIGLSLVKALIQAHDGKISVKSKIGEGSEFIIELPFRTVEECESFQSNMMYSSEQSKIDRIKIEFSDIYT
jgi:signal transduction histidine kinase